MNEFNDTYRQLLKEARPSRMFQHEPTINQAYQHALTVMRQHGETNAPTFAVWDYIWKCIPQELKTEDVVQLKNKNRTSGISTFIIEFLKLHKEQLQDTIIQDLLNDEKIIAYVTRPMEQRGNRARGGKKTREELDAALIDRYEKKLLRSDFPRITPL